MTTITAKLMPGPRPGTVRADVRREDVPGDDPARLERLAHALPLGERDIVPGMVLIESGVMPPEVGPWSTVWQTDDPAAAVGGSIRFTFTQHGTADPVTGSTTNTAQSKGSHMAIQDRIRNLADDPDLPPEHRETLRGVARGVERSAGLEKAHARAHALRKSDPSLSASKAMEQAMREPEIAALYKQEMEARAA